MKKILALVLCCLLLTGCQGITFSVEDLLTSPVIADEQTSIFQALTQGIGKSITLQYPYSGDYRSAIVLEDIDGSEGQEALAFYSEALNESVTGVAVLDKQNDGEWKLETTVTGVGTAIDRVIIHPIGQTVDIIIGYRTSALDESQVRMYRYINGNLATIYENTYTVLEKYDIDGCGVDEIVLARKAGDYVTVSVIKSFDGVNYIPYELLLTHPVTSIAEHNFGKISESNSALYLDLLNEGGALSTEIIYLYDEGISSPTNTVLGMREYTRRPSGYLCLDYDGDGVVEVPVVSNFTGYPAGIGTSNEYMTMWHTFNSQSSMLELKSNSYYSLTGGFVLTIPNRWLGLVTVKTNSETGEATFYKYDTEIASIDEMHPIMSIVSTYDQDAGKYSEEDGYRLVAQTERRQYFVKTMAQDGEQLVLTNDEILDNLYCLD
ncbi:MAG: hypothetical protein IJ424_00895 [Oscillospiraceae bacterium]|nr:hypothetical protein [Oscillospiraceae bacterium]